MNTIRRIKEHRRKVAAKAKAKRRQVSYIRWLERHSKNHQLGRVKSACCGFGRITTYGTGIENKGPTHFGCGPGFPAVQRSTK